ncbi:hypothetical protein HanRHA438_Chr09g0411961 [Helianthus annuus]|nr:hypothetical protein HanRHA438_Chr09g0411961 [Helianthus annuus]
MGKTPVNTGTGTHFHVFCIKPFRSGRLSISELNAASALANLFFLRNSSMASTFKSAISELH